MSSYVNIEKYLRLCNVIKDKVSLKNKQPMPVASVEQWNRKFLMDNAVECLRRKRR